STLQSGLDRSLHSLLFCFCLVLSCSLLQAFANASLPFEEAENILQEQAKKGTPQKTPRYLIKMAWSFCVTSYGKS
ncbi:MAG: hypothetical protein RR229_06205, partial [Oscillospiraceae bacterium]